MFKLLKSLLILIIVLLIGVVIFAFSFINSISYEVTADDLPQDVYESSDNLLLFAKTKIVGLVLADDDERYTLIEEIMNLIIFDSIRENINAEYDPLSDCTDNSCARIVDDENFYIDYAYAKLNDDNQIVITISAGTNRYVNVDTALIMVFDVDFGNTIGLDSSIVFTLDEYHLGDRTMSMKLLDMIFERMDKANIENNMTFGELDLDNYTYTISIADAIIS